MENKSETKEWGKIDEEMAQKLKESFARIDKLLAESKKDADKREFIDTEVAGKIGAVTGILVGIGTAAGAVALGAPTKIGAGAGVVIGVGGSLELSALAEKGAYKLNKFMAQKYPDKYRYYEPEIKQKKVIESGILK